MGEFNSDDHYIFYCGQEFLRRNGVALIVSKIFWNAVLGLNLKNNRMIYVHFQGKPFNIMVIQIYTPTSNAEDAEVEQFYEDLQDLLELTCKKDTWSNRQVWPWSTKWSRAKANRVFQREHTGHSKHHLSTTWDDCTHGHHQMVKTEIRLIIFFAVEDGKTLYS